MKDSNFLSEAKRLNLDIESSTGAELESVINDILATPKSVSQRLAAIIKSIPK